MIESLRLTDFQPHRRLSIEFDRHVTCLVGDSDKGKSSVLRAVEWVLTNRPPGKEMVGRFGKANYAAGRLKIDGHAITRKRGESVNSYSVDGEVLPSPGRGVPSAVSNIANVADVNFQGQFDGPFWFLLSPAEVSRRLNSIINLSVMDRALNIAGTKVRTAAAAVKVCKQRLRDAKIKRFTTAWAVRADAKLKKAERLFIKKDRLARRCATIAQDAIRLRHALGAVREADHARRIALCKLRAVRMAIDLRTRADGLESLIVELGRLRTAERPRPSLNALRAAWTRYRAAYAKQQGLGSLWLQLKTMLYNGDLIGQTVTDLKRILSEVKTCPLCKQPLTRS